MAENFAWGLFQGVAVILFLVTACIHLLIGVLGPLFAFSSAAGRSILFVATRPDTALYGAKPDALLASEPRLELFRRTAFMAMSGLLVGLGICEMATAWFGIGGGHRWALVALAVSGFAMLPYWILVFRPYIAAGIPLSLGDLPPFIWIPAAVLVPASVLGWAGLT